MQAGSKESLLVATAPASSENFADAVATARPYFNKLIYFISRLSVCPSKGFSKASATLDFDLLILHPVTKRFCMGNYWSHHRLRWSSI